MQSRINVTNNFPGVAYNVLGPSSSMWPSNIIVKGGLIWRYTLLEMINSRLLLAYTFYDDLLMMHIVTAVRSNDLIDIWTPPNLLLMFSHIKHLHH